MTAYEHDSRVWMAHRAERRAKVDIFRTSFLEMALQSFENGDIARLHGERQSAALWDIAAHIGSAIAIGSADVDLKAKVVRAIPKLLGDAKSDPADARLFFWDVFLGPASNWSRLPAVIRTAVSESLANQARSDVAGLRWSAAWGVRALPEDMSRAILQADPATWKDSDMQAILRFGFRTN